MADDEKQDQSDPPIPAKKNAQKKIRPTYSCLNCHKRKVKVHSTTYCLIITVSRLANQLTTMVRSVIE